MLITFENFVHASSWLRGEIKSAESVVDELERVVKDNPLALERAGERLAHIRDLQGDVVALLRDLVPRSGA